MKSIVVNTARKGGRAHFAHEISEIAKTDGVKIIYPENSSYCGDMKFHFHSLKFFLDYIKLMRVLLSYKRIYLTSFSPILIFIMLIKRDFYFICHDPIHSFDRKVMENGFFKSIFYFALQRFVERRSKKIILLNARDYKKYLIRYSYDKVIEGFHPVFSFKKSENEKEFDFGFFGRISSHKGIEDFIKIEGEIREKNPCLKSIICGEGDILNGKAVSESIFFLNEWVDDDEMLSYISKTKVVVLPYQAATQSGIVSLAYSQNVPVIVSNVGGLAEQVIDCYTGYVVNKDDLVGFENKILRLVRDPQLLNELEQNIKKNNLEHSWEKLYNLIGFRYEI